MLNFTVLFIANPFRLNCMIINYFRRYNGKMYGLSGLFLS